MRYVPIFFREGNIVKLTDGVGNTLTDFVILDRGYTGHEHLSKVGLVHMNGRLYDPLLHRFLSPDNFVQDPSNTQNYNRYGYVLNNPLSHVDPSGEFIPLLAIGIGALIGGYSGYKIGKANGATGWAMFGYIGGGALIGAASGGAAAGISAAGGGAILAGAGAGTLGGAGFSGLATKWDGNAMLRGAFIGGISGAIGGGFASAIGGGAGAFFGGATSNITGQLLSTGDINFGQALLSGGISLGLYHGVSYASWKWGGGNTLGNQDISYRQYSTMQADFQRSRFWGKEYGGFLMEDGRAIRFPKEWRHSHGVEPPSGNSIKALTGTKAIYHTHWDRPGKSIFVDVHGNRVDNSGDLSLISSGRLTTTARGHGVYDFAPVNSYVINRYETTFNYGSTSGLLTLNDPFLRFFPWFGFK